MREHRHFAAWLRMLAGLVALSGLLGLGGCGGGSGAPNNVFNTPGPVTVLPAAAVVYSGVPVVLTVSGGTPPYRAFSSNSAIVPVTQGVAGSTIVLLPGPVTTATDVNVVITVQDNPNTGGTVPAQATVALTVRAAPLVNSLTIAPTTTDCGTTAICSGQTGTAAVTVLGPQGGALAGRAVKFDVLSGPYLITTTNPAQPLVNSLTVVSDANGLASVIVKANAGAPTQYAQLQVTDLTSGQQIVGNFLIQQVIDGTKTLSVVPATATITGSFKGICSTNFYIDYFIYGGTPPYRITSTFPQAVVLSPSTVNDAGGYFRAITNGYCVDPLTFSIVDASGLQTTATLINKEGSDPIPTAPAPAALAISPPTVSTSACDLKTFTFLVSGGTPSYNQFVTPTVGVVTPPSGGTQFTVTGLPAGTGTYAVIVQDQGSPKQNATATINCS